MAAIFEGSAQDTLISLDSLIGFLKGKTTFDVQWSTNIVVTNWLTKYYLVNRKVLLLKSSFCRAKEPRLVAVNFRIFH